MGRLALTFVLISASASACEAPGSSSADPFGLGELAKADDFAAPFDCGALGDWVCTSPAELACAGGETAERFDCTGVGRVCGYDYDARRVSCVKATEHCDRPGQPFCLTSIDAADCSEAGTILPGEPCLLGQRLCGWDEDAYDPESGGYGRMGCVEAPPACGRLDEPCCGTDTCGNGLLCFEGACVSKSPGCGSEAEPCCDGVVCHEGYACSDGYCVTASGNCGRAGEGCCYGVRCAAGLACAAGTCAAE